MQHPTSSLATSHQPSPHSANAPPAHPSTVTVSQLSVSIQRLPVHLLFTCLSPARPGVHCQSTSHLLFICPDLSPTRPLASIHPISHGSPIYIQPPPATHSPSPIPSFVNCTTHPLPPISRLPPTQPPASYPHLSSHCPPLSTLCTLSPSSCSALFVPNPLRCHLPPIPIYPF